jgi:hypothetical protein
MPRIILIVIESSSVGQSKHVGDKARAVPGQKMRRRVELGTHAGAKRALNPGGEVM